ncbi:MAG: DNA cytosine methyltransferase [bacterium]
MTDELQPRRDGRVRSIELLACAGKTVLSLFDRSGNWSRPYAEAGANVVQLDLKLGVDIMDLDCAWLSENVLEANGTVDGILAAPPCTDFAVSGAQYWTAKDKSGQTAKSLELVRQVLRCVEYLKPDWWAMENPVGRLNKLLPELKQYGPWYFQPHDFGDAYTKRTGLWGRYVPPMPLWSGDKSVQPVRVCSQGSWLQKLGGKSEKTKTLRSATPMGFARAFFAANCWGATQQANDQAQTPRAND